MCWPSGRPLPAVEPSRLQTLLQAFYPESFTREYGCTEPEWAGWLPAALGDGEVHRRVGALTQHWPEAPGASLQLEWAALPPRVIALAVLPRLEVHFRFAGLDEAQRFRYMRRFDLYMQRGGG
jgi:hypothetical protein